MTPHQVASAIEADVRAFALVHPANLEAEVVVRLAFCCMIEARLRELRRAIGVPERLSLSTGRREDGERTFDVVARGVSRASQPRTARGPRNRKAVFLQAEARLQALLKSA